MKILKGLDEKVQSLDENNVDLQPFRDFYVAAVKFSIKKSGDEAVDLFEIALKLKHAQDSVELEDAQFKLVKTACNENPIGWPAIIHGQIFKKLQEAEKN